jgi:hypothetical protein
MRCRTMNGGCSNQEAGEFLWKGIPVLRTWRLQRSCTYLPSAGRSQGGVDGLQGGTRAEG